MLVCSKDELLKLPQVAQKNENIRHLLFCKSLIGKAILSAKLTPTEKHILYGGVGLLGFFDTDNNYMLGVGPAVQFAWKFPNKQSELHFDLLLPLLFKHNYEEAIPDDDWPSSASFVYVMLIIMAPTIGFSWSF